MKGLLFYVNMLFGKEPTKKDKTYAQKELDFFMRGRGATGRFVRKGEKFRRSYKKKKEEKIGDRKVVGKVSEIIDEEE